MNASRRVIVSGLLALTFPGVAAARNVAQQDRSELPGLVSKNVINGPGCATFGPGRFVVACPIVSSD